jgi:Tfp pilus assembly protein PilN
LNELQKQQKRADQQAQEIAKLMERIQMLEGRLAEIGGK